MTYDCEGTKEKLDEKHDKYLDKLMKADEKLDDIYEKWAKIDEKLFEIAEKELEIADLEEEIKETLEKIDEKQDKLMEYEAKNEAASIEYFEKLDERNIKLAVLGNLDASIAALDQSISNDNAQITAIVTQLEDPTLDPVERTLLEQQLAALIAQIGIKEAEYQNLLDERVTAAANLQEAEEKLQQAFTKRQDIYAKFVDTEGELIELDDKLTEKEEKLEEKEIEISEKQDEIGETLSEIEDKQDEWQETVEDCDKLWEEIIGLENDYYAHCD